MLCQLGRCLPLGVSDYFLFADESGVEPFPLHPKLREML
jgi:hypothetical protein